MQIACAVLSSVTCLALSHFSTLPNKLHDFREKLLIINHVFLFSLQFLSEIFLILIRIERDITTNVQICSRKVPFILSDFNEN